MMARLRQSSLRTSGYRQSRPLEKLQQGKEEEPLQHVSQKIRRVEKQLECKLFTGAA
ncbi:hypothetical protein OK016_05375 [Vibrio chagasii]|nr:hypothetical protein [Vibrio chagasii]